MSQRIRVKPGKGQSMAGFLGGIVFCFLGLFIVIPIFGPFGIVWTLFAVIITVVNGLNAFSSMGVASHEITIDDDYEQSNLENGKTSEERLNELQNLYEKNMISPDEYQAKRKQILDDL